eukprot:2199197-Rhodomonas_salina.2
MHWQVHRSSASSYRFSPLSAYARVQLYPVLTLRPVLPGVRVADARCHIPLPEIPQQRQENPGGCPVCCAAASKCLTHPVYFATSVFGAWHPLLTSVRISHAMSGTDVPHGGTRWSTRYGKRRQKGCERRR